MTQPEWAIKLQTTLDQTQDTSVKLAKWNRNRCIYKVPNYLRDTDSKFYEPVKVSLGPYHHGKPDLQPMEEHKERVLVQFLKRSETPLNIIIEALRKELENLKDAYGQLDQSWQKDNMDTDKFLQVMLWDGCFILEVLNVSSKNVTYPVDDPIFGIDGSTSTLPLITRDMLLLENQVPFLVIKILFAVTEVPQGSANRDEIPDELLYLLFSFFSTPTSPLSLVWSKISGKQCSHLLDVCREILLYDDPHVIYKIKTKRGYISPYVDTLNFPSASKLYESGIQFKTSSTKHLKDISFKGSTLRFPPIIIADETVSTLANLMAFERVHAGAANEVTSYVFFMKCLINDEADVSLLQNSGIIQTSLSKEHLVNSLRLLSRDVLLGPNNALNEVYTLVSQKLRDRVTKTLKEWQFDLLRNYFKTPWGVLSVIAAVVLFALSAIQTVYSVLSYTHPPK